MPSIVVVVITIRKGRRLGSQRHIGAHVLSLKCDLKETGQQGSGGQGGGLGVAG